MRFLRRNYRVLSLEDMLRELSDPSSLDPGVAITFDDGYRSAYTQAFPTLKEYQLPATIYLTMGTIETGQVAWYDRVFTALGQAPTEELQIDLEGPWRLGLFSREARLRSALEIVAFFRTLPNSRREECCARLEKILGLPRAAVSGKVLTWDEIHLMQKSGIAFGSHTMTHPVVSQLSETELEHELFDSRRILEEKLGSPVRDFAFPFGKASDCGLATAGLLSGYGYRSAVTTVAGVNKPHTNRFELRRMQTGHNCSLARFSFDLARAFLDYDRSEAGSSLHDGVTSNNRAHGSEKISEAIGGSGA
jgi:peptidoglycan/xylan/chitin deacetylase (PgdA/CDA1 family)